MTDATPAIPAERIDAFITRWNKAGGSEAGKAQPTARDELDVDTEEPIDISAAKSIECLPWPKELTDQVKSVADLLSASRKPMSEENIAASFAGKGPWKKRLPMILEMLVAVGQHPAAG